MPEGANDHGRVAFKNRDWRLACRHARARIRSDDHGRSIRYQNVERYRRLLRTVIDEGRRSFLLGLLAEAQQKQKDAGDSKYQY